MPCYALHVRIVRFVDQAQPGWVECELVDALGGIHCFVEKVPVVSRDDLRIDSVYPCDGTIACELADTWDDATGRQLMLVDTSLPWDIESIAGESCFTVSPTQVKPIEGIPNWKAQ